MRSPKSPHPPFEDHLDVPAEFDEHDPFAYLEEGAIMPPPKPVQLTRTRSRRSFLAMGMAAIGATAWFGVPLNTEGAFFPGTQVNGLDIAELDRPQALALLRAHYAAFENTAVDYEFEGQRWNASLAQLGFSIDYESTLEAAWQHGRNTSRMTQFTQVMFNPEEKSYPVLFKEMPATLTGYLEDLGTQIVGIARDASLYLDEDQVRIMPNVDGRELNIEAAAEATQAAVVTAERATVKLTARPVVSQITVDDLEPKRSLAQTMISRPISIETPEATWSVSQATLRAALILPEEGVLTDPSFNETVIAESLNDMDAETRTEPADAVLGWANGLTVVTPDVRGRKLNVAATVSDIATAAKLTDDRSVNARFDEVLADVNSENLDDLGIIDLISEGSSSYEGSSWERAENVRVSAEHLTHTLVKPGDTYSFNDAIGLITLDNGFVEGQIIRGSYIQSDIGGGACQASTTVFRAALYAGLPITHHYHQYRLAFYELDGWSPGLDAAIYQPNDPGDTNYEVDLTFENNTEHWLLVECYTDGVRAYSKIYGTPQGWDVDVQVPYISEPKKPEKPIETEDPKLAKGEREQVGFERDGFDVQAVRTITRDGQIVAMENNPWEFWSYFQPQRETWLIGPGTKRQFDDGTPETSGQE